MNVPLLLTADVLLALVAILLAWALINTRRVQRSNLRLLDILYRRITRLEGLIGRMPLSESQEHAGQETKKAGPTS